MGIWFLIHAWIKDGPVSKNGRSGPIRRMYFRPRGQAARLIAGQAGTWTKTSDSKSGQS